MDGRVRVGYKHLIPLPIDDGDYPSSPEGEPLNVYFGDVQFGKTFEKACTVISAVFQVTSEWNLRALHSLRLPLARRLLTRTNRFLRWYRAASLQSDVTELTLAQANTFHFDWKGPTDAVVWTGPLEIADAEPLRLDLSVEELSTAIRSGFRTGKDPEVPRLFLLDAEHAIHQGRFREAVLFCWSTIDSVFNRKYNALVDQRLGAEWSKGKEYLKGFEFGLRNKMSIGLQLLTNRSLFGEPNDLWKRLSESYAIRNAIIHQGGMASELEALDALEVAKSLVIFMNTISVPVEES